MPKQGKSPKKKTKEKSPQRTGESEYPEMDQDEFNRLLQNVIEQSKAELQQRHEEQLKAVEDRLTRLGKFDELYQTVHLKEFTDFPKKDEKDPTTVFTDIHFEKKSIAHEAYHLSHGYCQ